MWNLPVILSKHHIIIINIGIKLFKLFLVNTSLLSRISFPWLYVLDVLSATNVTPHEQIQQHNQCDTTWTNATAQPIWHHTNRCYSTTNVTSHEQLQQHNQYDITRTDATAQPMWHHTNRCNSATTVTSHDQMQQHNQCDITPVVLIMWYHIGGAASPEHHHNVNSIKRAVST